MFYRSGCVDSRDAADASPSCALYKTTFEPPLSHLYISSSPHHSRRLHTNFLSTSFTMPAKKRCQLQAETPCNSAALRIVGQCPHCRVEFCGAHRLPEHHNCNKLEDCRQQAFEKNKAKLESERTVASKMATA